MQRVGWYDIRNHEVRKDSYPKIEVRKDCGLPHFWQWKNFSRPPTLMQSTKKKNNSDDKQLSNESEAKTFYFTYEVAYLQIPHSSQ